MRDTYVELEDLVGEHLLDAVEYDSTRIGSLGTGYRSCRILRFRLDGKCYAAIEKPEGGYRTGRHSIVPWEGYTMRNVFTPLRVLGRYCANGPSGSEHEVLELISVANGAVVLEAGTANTNDYYPQFIASFHPEVIPTKED